MTNVCEVTCDVSEQGAHLLTRPVIGLLELVKENVGTVI